MYQREGPREIGEPKQEPIRILDQKLKSLDSEGPPQTPAARSQTAPAAPNLETESGPHLRDLLRCMIAQEVKRKCTKRSHEATQRAVKNALSNLFVTRAAEIEEGMTNVLYQPLETIRATMAEKGTLDEVFDRSSERWTQSALFMDALNRRALNAPRLTQPVANFERSRMKKPLKLGTYRPKAKLYHHQNSVIHGHKLCHYPGLATTKYTRNIAEPAARLK